MPDLSPVPPAVSGAPAREARAVPAPRSSRSLQPLASQSTPVASGTWGPCRRTAIGAVLASLVLAACATVEGLDGGGVPTEVVLLGGGFVYFDGQRVPTETFVLAIRARIRAAAGDTARYPAVRILVEGGLPPGGLDYLLRELQSAGVRHVKLG